MKGLYSELMGFITGKGLRQEDLRRLRESYNQREKEAFYRAMSHAFDNLNAPQSDKLWGWLGGLAVSSVSALGAGYYDYSASMEQIHREITSGTWQLRKEEIEACNSLQKKLLDSTWTLLRKYHLPNEYRLRQEDVSEFLGVMNEANASKRLGRLKFIERKFRVYPPYWFFRADSALSAGDKEEASACFWRFNEVWRPVLDYDPYKLEATKYRIGELAEDGVPSGDTADEIRRLVEVIRDYTAPGDWRSNLFAGIVYFALGNKDEAVTCVEYGNVTSGLETEISGVILAQMKQGRIDVAGLPGELRGLFGKQDSNTEQSIKRISGIQASPEFYARADLSVLRGKRIGITIQSLRNAYWAGVMTALAEVLQAAEAEYTIVGCNDSSATQNSQIENFVSAGCDLIMVHPSDAKAVEDVCAEAMIFGINVMCWDDDMTSRYADSNPRVTASNIAGLMANSMID